MFIFCLLALSWSPPSPPCAVFPAHLLQTRSGQTVKKRAKVQLFFDIRKLNLEENFLFCFFIYFFTFHISFPCAVNQRRINRRQARSGIHISQYLFLILNSICIPEKEFALPYFEFFYDEHWDLGRLVLRFVKTTKRHNYELNITHSKIVTCSFSLSVCGIRPN